MARRSVPSECEGDSVMATFTREPAKYIIVCADTSMYFASTDDELEDLLDLYENRKIDVRVYKLDQKLLFSDPSTDADRH